ncbi:MAG: hypothetical protein EXS68_01530 [Candidatus Ryanbacteria bacterium]|nr:hypothetical protein [Candidatus Ryanbacteria bacterium]
MDAGEAKLHLGYRYGFIGNPKGFVRDGVALYADTDTKKEVHTPYLHGLWIVRADEIEYAGEPAAGYLAFNDSGTYELVGDSDKCDIQIKDGTIHVVPQTRGVVLREIIFRDSRV